MATTQATLLALIRNMINDNTQNGVDIYTYTSSAIFTLSEANAQEISDVSVNETSSGITYSFDETLKKVTVASTLSVDDIIEIDYTYYSNYSDTELVSYIKNSLVHLSINQYGDYELDTDDSCIYPNPSVGEMNLIASIVSILINPDNKSYRTPDFSITVKNNMSGTQMIAKAIAVFKKSAAGLSIIL